MSEECEETGSSGPYFLVQPAEDALKDIQQRESVHTETAERQVFYKYDCQSWGEAIEDQTRD